MKKLFILILVICLGTVTATAQRTKTVFTLRDSATIAADSVNIGPLNFDYMWTLTAEFWSLDDVDAAVIRWGGATNTGPWVPIDTLVLADTTNGVAGLQGLNLHYLYYKHKVDLNSVTAGEMRLKMTRIAKKP